jgi:hypothetical protein
MYNEYVCMRTYLLHYNGMNYLYPHVYALY